MNWIKRKLIKLLNPAKELKDLGDKIQKRLDEQNPDNNPKAKYYSFSITGNEMGEWMVELVEIMKTLDIGDKDEKKIIKG